MQRYPPATELVPLDELEDELADVKADWTAVNVAIGVNLIDQDFVLTPGLVYGDLHKASYPGYAEKTATVASLGNTQTEGDGSVRQESTTLIVFPEPTSGDPVTIYGYMLTEAAAHTRLYRVFRFSTPVVMAPGGGPLNIILTVTQRGGTF